VSQVRQPHWAEGMLLLPHHFQTAQRAQAALLDQAWTAAQPFSWGFADLVISDTAIRDGAIAIERCRARTAEGSWIEVPGNADVAPRPFEKFLTASPDGMMVYLAIPKLHEIRPNAAGGEIPESTATRYLIEPLEVRDENTGDNARQIEVHMLRARLLFGDESRLPGFELLPVARVYLSGEEGGVPRRDASYVPPLLGVGVSAELQRMINDIIHEAGARNRELAAEATKREMSFRSGIEEHNERLLMIHVLNESLAFLRQVAVVPQTRPFTAYAELCRLAGQLSVFSPDRAVKAYPLYEHAKIGEHFKLLCEHIRVLLQALSVGRVKWRDFELREGGEGLKVLLDDEWLTGRVSLYVGVHCSTMDEIELDRLLKKLNWKVGAIDEVDMLFRAGLPGLELRPVRSATGMLPASPEIKYYQAIRDPERWPKVETAKVLAIRYSPDAQAKLENVRFRVYVLLEKH